MKIGKFNLFLLLALLLAVFPLAYTVTKQAHPLSEEQEYAAGGQLEILEEYLAQQDRRDAVVAQVEKQFGKSFPEFTMADYSQFMNSLDLSREGDLWKWSLVTGIPILAVSKRSNFFYRNQHLLLNAEEADRIGLSNIETSYDKKTGELQVLTAEGRELPIRKVPDGTIRLTERSSGFSHLRDYGEDRIFFEVLQPYLVRLAELEYRDAIATWIKSLPLSVVKVYTGMGIYFTTQTGRSYAVAMPVSNSTYEVFVGLQTGVFVDPRRDGPAGTAKNFVHEIGHLIDYTVIKGGYGSYRQPHQFPEIRKKQAEKELVFGARDHKVPQTPYGYISRYARANAQESFAEHFRAYILEKEKFLDSARKEDSEGHPELMEKYRFMENLLDDASPRMVRLSPEYLTWEKIWQEGYEELSSHYRTRKNLGDEAPDSLTQLIDGRLATAFTNR
jgi:hypothetical protein